MKTYHFLHDYDAEQLRLLNELVDVSVHNLPYTLAFPIVKLFESLEKENYGLSMNYALDFFETSAQYMSYLLFSFLENEPYASDEKVQDVLVRIVNKIDTKRPLSFGDWTNEILPPLFRMASQCIPNNPLVKAIKGTVMVRKYNLFLGDKHNPSIVTIRNEYKGHSTTLSENIYRNVTYTLEERLCQLLVGLKPLTEWDFYACSKDDSQQLRVFRLRGAALQEENPFPAGIPFEAFHYYVSAGACEGFGERGYIDLFPFVFCNQNNYVYLFQSLKEESISYISSNENAITYSTDEWNECFDIRLKKIKPSFDIAKDLNWNEIRELSKTESKMFLKRTYDEKKYNRELFVDRKILSGYFDEFVQSDKSFLPLLGEAGQGKTNQLCFWTENLLDKDKCVLIFNSSEFSDFTLGQKLRKVFGLNRHKPLEKLLDALHEKAVAEQESVYFVFDAINECLTYNEQDETGAHNVGDGPLELFKAINQLLLSECYPQFKVLLTCRNYTWKNQILPHVQIPKELVFERGEDKDIYVRGFLDDELKEAYSIYKLLYQMETPFESIQKHVMIRLKDPLVLKIACTNFLSSDLLDDSLSYTSISLFEKMFGDIRRSYAGKVQCDILSGIGKVFLESYEKGIPIDSISVKALKEAYKRPSDPLHALAKLIFKNEKNSVAYGELLNKPERPILRLIETSDPSEEGSVQFIYERFMEYILARVFMERELLRLNETEILSAATINAELNRSATNVVFMGVLSNILIMDYLRSRNPQTLIDLVEQYGDNYDIMLLITNVLNVLTKENYQIEIFDVLNHLVHTQIENGEQLTQKYNEMAHLIEKNLADAETIKNYTELSGRLAPQFRLRKLASVCVFKGIFLSEYFNEGLYSDKTFELVWSLITDSINEVKNDACLYIYYLSNKKYTTEYSPLKQNLTDMIVREMFRISRGHSLWRNIGSTAVRTKTMNFVETAIRISVLLIIDISRSQKTEDRDRINMILDEITGILHHFTYHFVLIRLFLPILKPYLHKQVTFQASYVNNTIEYQTFWERNIVPEHSDTQWCRSDLRTILPMIYYNNREKSEFFRSNALVMPNESIFVEKVLSAYECADSFSYFGIERILVIVGYRNWPLVRQIASQFFADYRQNPWFDYSQMSMLYVLFQLAVNTPEDNEGLLEMFSRECEDWTLRCHGLFKAHNSHKANPTQMYKRNVMNWYCVVYCRHTGDNVPHEQDERCVPVFYKLIDQALATYDKELLYHLIDNIIELVTDFGYIKTALGLMKYIMERVNTVEKLQAFDEVKLERDGIYQECLTNLIGRFFGTAKNYFSKEVDDFVYKDVMGMSFPGISKYLGELLNYTPGGESLSDLFTHRFGNYLMWALLNEEKVDNFAYEAMDAAIDQSSSFKWFDKVISILFKHLFKVHL